jgi:hypothetical protein
MSTAAVPFRAVGMDKGRAPGLAARRKEAGMILVLDVDGVPHPEGAAT